MPFRIAQIPVATRSQMLKLEELAEQKYGIGELQLTENAGRALAEVCRGVLNGLVDGRTIVLFCGPGQKGARGLCAARYLASWGSCVSVLLCGDLQSQLARQYHHTLVEMGVAIQPLGTGSLPEEMASKVNLCVDALVDYSTTQPPDSCIVKGIVCLNALKKNVVALDVPSGLDCDTGQTHEPFVKANFTVTMALPKPGLMCEETKHIVGKLFLADIGIPPMLLEEISLAPNPIFVQESIIALDEAPPNYLWQQCQGILLQK